MAQVLPLKIDTTAGVVKQFGTGDTIAPAYLGTGTPDNTKYLRGDGAWAAFSSAVDWANPGTIGSGTPNTGVFTSLVAATADINGGTIDGAVIGATTPAAGTFTALTSTGNTVLGNASTDTLNVGNGGIIKDASGNVGIGLTPSGSFKLEVIEHVYTGGAGGFVAHPSATIGSNLYYSGGWKYAGNGFGWVETFGGSGERVHYSAPSNAGGAGAAATLTKRLHMSSDMLPVTMSSTGIAGAFNGTIGATTPAAGTFTNGSFTGTLGVTGAATTGALRSTDYVEALGTYALNAYYSTGWKRRNTSVPFLISSDATSLTIYGDTSAGGAGSAWTTNNWLSIVGATGAVTIPGTLGIGVTPTEKLDVSGAIKFTGSTASFATTTSVGMVDFANAGARILSFGADASTYGQITFYQAKQNNGAGRNAMVLDSSGNFTSVGVHLGPNGSAAAPTYSFSSSGNSDNGMYLSAANTLAFATSGTKQLEISSAGVASFTGAVTSPDLAAMADGTSSITYPTGVTEANPSSLRRGVDGFCVLSTYLQIDGTYASGGLVLTLPAGYRPTVTLYSVPVFWNDSSATPPTKVALATISTDGTIYVYYAHGEGVITLGTSDVVGIFVTFPSR